MPLVTTRKRFFSTVENVAKLSAKVLYYNMRSPQKATILGLFKSFHCTFTVIYATPQWA